MKEFCPNCAELEAQIENMRTQHFKEMQCMKQKLNDASQSYKRVSNENDKLALDLAFYNKDIILNNNK